MPDDYDIRRRFWYAIAGLVSLLCVVLVVNQVSAHHAAEEAFADRYQVTNVDLPLWPEAKYWTWWTNTAGTERCEGVYMEQELTVWDCDPITPPAPEPAR